jgi:hypothetical protein
MLVGVPTYLLAHSHLPAECGVVFAAWRGFDSPLRHHPTLGSCRQGAHRLWWTVEAPDARAALAQLPPYVAARTHVGEVSEVAIP